MSHPRRPRLYDLLPAFHRIQDVAQGEPLRALLEIVDGELDRIEDDVEQLYENWFVETCDAWAVPYLGDLMRVPHLRRTHHGKSARAYVANTIRYRRRKGTAAVIEQLARDVTGWPARAVEFFQHVAWNQHVNHVRSDASVAPDLRKNTALELVASPFDPFAHTVDVRRADSTGPRHNLPNIGVYFWRLKAYAVRRSPAWTPAAAPDGRFHIHRLGQDAPLFHTPRTETDISHLASEVDVPGPLRRRPLYEELEARRQAKADGLTPKPTYFDKMAPLGVWVVGEPKPIPPEEITICDLSGSPLSAAAGTWRRPPAKKEYTRSDGTTVELPIRCGVDPVLGRLAFPATVPAPTKVLVDYAYGFAADIGGGPYHVPAAKDRSSLTFTVRVARGLPFVAGATAPSLQKAVQDFNGRPANTVGRIEVEDSERHTAPAVTIVLKEGSVLKIVAKEGAWPHVIGTWKVRGTGGRTPGALTIQGLLFEGEVRVLPGDLGELTLSHVTQARSIVGPTNGRYRVQSQNTDGKRNDRLRSRILSSLVGPVQLSNFTRRCEIRDAVVDPRTGTGSGIDAPAAHLDIVRCTVLGTTRVRSLDATDSLFMDTVTTQRSQEGCVRYSFVSAGSHTPRRFRCEPDLSLERRADELGLENASDLPAPEAARIRRTTTPGFESLAPGQPAFAQLARRTAQSVRRGGETGSEMGAFAQLEEAHREANFLDAVEEYVRFGLEIGLDYET